jgi:hypothetical protein
MGQYAEKRFLNAPKRSACPCPKTYPFLAATLPTVRDEQFMSLLYLLIAAPPFQRTGAANYRGDGSYSADVPFRTRRRCVFLDEATASKAIAVPARTPNIQE